MVLLKSARVNNILRKFQSETDFTRKSHFVWPATNIHVNLKAVVQDLNKNSQSFCLRDFKKSLILFSSLWITHPHLQPQLYIAITYVPINVLEILLDLGCLSFFAIIV